MMKRSDEFAKIKEQSEFCADLMLRLNADIQESGHGSWSGMDNHTRKQSDIVRLRRELMSLQKMLYPYGND